MRVSIVGAQFPDSLARNFSVAFQRMGHTVQNVDQEALYGPLSAQGKLRPLRRFIEFLPRLHAMLNERILRQLVAFQPEFVLSTYTYWQPDAVHQARSKLPAATKIVYLYPDPIAHMVREYPLAAGYDALFFKDPFTVEMFRSHLGLNAHYLPEACNPVWHRIVELSPADLETYACDIATAGSLYYYRALQLEALLDYDVKVWGTNLPPWVVSPVRSRYMNHFVAEIEKSKAFRAAKIVLNTCTAKEFEGTNARTFEAAGCGAFQIADWRPALEDLFRIDEEIVTYRSREELLEKVAFYLARPEARRRIAEAGYRRAHADHTYEKRIGEMLRIGCGNTSLA